MPKIKRDYIATIANEKIKYYWEACAKACEELDLYEAELKQFEENSKNMDSDQQLAFISKRADKEAELTKTLIHLMELREEIFNLMSYELGLNDIEIDPETNWVKRPLDEPRIVVNLKFFNILTWTIVIYLAKFTQTILRFFIAKQNIIHTINFGIITIHYLKNLKIEAEKDFKRSPSKCIDINYNYFKIIKRDLNDKGYTDYIYSVIKCLLSLYVLYVVLQYCFY